MLSMDRVFQDVAAKQAALGDAEFNSLENVLIRKQEALKPVQTLLNSLQLLGKNSKDYSFHSTHVADKALHYMCQYAVPHHLQWERTGTYNADAVIFDDVQLGATPEETKFVARVIRVTDPKDPAAAATGRGGVSLDLNEALMLVAHWAVDVVQEKEELGRVAELFKTVTEALASPAPAATP